MSTNDGGPAFPQAFTAVATGEHVDLTVPCPGEYATGMTLRDYFAGQAVIAAVHARLPDDNVGVYTYKVADAMIAERTKT